MIQNTSIIIGHIDDRERCESQATDTGGYVESSLEAFVQNSTWQFGLVDENDDQVITNRKYWPVPKEKGESVIWQKEGKLLRPLMWYGMPDQQPIGYWTVKAQESSDDTIWTKEDEWEQLELLIGGSDDYFLTWYFPECGRCVPDINQIRDECPITWSDSDTPEELEKKISVYMMEQIISVQNN